MLRLCCGWVDGSSGGMITEAHSMKHVNKSGVSYLPSDLTFPREQLLRYNID